MPAVPPASLSRRFSFNPENETLPSNLHPTPDPSTSELSPACLPSPSPSLTFGASGLVSRAGKERGVGGCFYFPFLFPPPGSRPLSLEKRVQAGKGVYHLQGSVISG